MTRRRRDPRAETQALTTSTQPRRRITRGTPIPSPTNRRRRDPRAERATASIQIGTRRRFDWSGVIQSAAGSPETAAAAGPTVRIIEDLAFLVLVVPDQPRGELTAHDRQLIAAGRILADAGGGAVAVLTPDRETTPDDLATAGADRLIKADPDLFTAYCPEQRAASVLDAVEALNPRHVLFAESADGGSDLARRVAASTGERLFPGVQNLTPTSVGRRARGGSSELSHAPARLMTIALDAVPPLEDARHEARVIPTPSPNPTPVTPGIRTARPLPVDPDQLTLAEADFIVSAGNGITDWASFAEVAATLGATRGGSRVVCDAGHLPRDRQIGASGTLVTARCYFALGIAGAPQHLQGITEVKHVIAVNTDLHAEMIKRADLAIVADAQTVMPALIRYARERRKDQNRV
jgi:electron transfer flavoprotein alpha subunit